MRIICFTFLCALIVNHAQASESATRQPQKKSNLTQKKAPKNIKEPKPASVKNVKKFQIRKSVIESSIKTPPMKIKQYDKNENSGNDSNQKSPQDPSFHQGFPHYTFDKKHPTIATLKASQHQPKYSMEGRKVYSEKNTPAVTFSAGRA